MKVTYDASVDVLRIVFTDAPIAESSEEKPGVILDYAEDGALIGIELLDASKRVTNPGGVDYTVVGLKSA